MALFILARHRAKLSPLQKQICGADRGKVCLKSLDWVMTVWVWPKGGLKHWLFRDLTWITDDIHRYFQGRKECGALEVCCLTETSLSSIKNYFWFLFSRHLRASLVRYAAQSLTGGVSLFQLGSFRSSPSCEGGVKSASSVIYHPSRSDLLFSQMQAIMILADPLWMQVDMTHIIIHHGGELGKEGRVWGAGVREGRRGQSGPDSLSRAAKIPPASSPSGLVKHPHPDQKPSTLPLRWWIKKQTSTHARRALRGASKRRNVDQRWKMEGTGPLFLFHLTGLSCSWFPS